MVAKVATVWLCIAAFVRVVPSVVAALGLSCSNRVLICSCFVLVAVLHSVLLWRSCCSVVVSIRVSESVVVQTN